MGKKLKAIEPTMVNPSEKIDSDPASCAWAHYDRLAKEKTISKIKEKKWKYFPNINEFTSKISKAASIVDLGCGLGVAANYFKMQDFETYGVDISEETIKKAEQAFPGIQFYSGDIRNFFSFVKRKFHGIYENLSLMNLPKDEVIRIFQVVYDYLEQGGVFHTCFEEGTESETGWYHIPITATIVSKDGSPMCLSQLLYLSYFQKHELENLLQTVGFQILKSEKIKQPLYTKRITLSLLCKKP